MYTSIDGHLIAPHNLLQDLWLKLHILKSMVIAMSCIFFGNCSKMYSKWRKGVKNVCICLFIHQHVTRQVHSFFLTKIKQFYNPHC